MEVRAVSHSAEALNVRPAMTLLRSCAAGVGVTIAAGEPDVVEGMRGERKVMDAAGDHVSPRVMGRGVEEAYKPHSSPRGHHPRFRAKCLHNVVLQESGRN